MASILERLHSRADEENELAARRVRAGEAVSGERLAQARRYEIYGQAPLASPAEVGQLLYLLVLSVRARRIIEFGCSRGVSSIYLASAIRDCGGGTLITSEFDERKLGLAKQNLADAGRDDFVELRVGDAIHTVGDVAWPIDLVFLDGRNDLYLPVLRLLEAHLSPSAMVVADLSAEDPDLLPYLEHVRDRTSGDFSMTVPLDDGVELSTRERTDAASHGSPRLSRVLDTIRDVARLSV